MRVIDRQIRGLYLCFIFCFYSPYASSRFFYFNWDRLWNLITWGSLSHLEQRKINVVLGPDLVCVTKWCLCEVILGTFSKEHEYFMLPVRHNALKSLWITCIRLIIQNFTHIDLMSSISMVYNSTCRQFHWHVLVWECTCQAKVPCCQLGKITNRREEGEKKVFSVCGCFGIK